VALRSLSWEGAPSCHVSRDALAINWPRRLNQPT
jgi:hypothetical protein